MPTNHMTMERVEQQTIASETAIPARYRRIAGRFSERTAEMTTAAWNLPSPREGG
jgi:hypothetical protein